MLNTWYTFTKRQNVSAPKGPSSVAQEYKTVHSQFAEKLWDSSITANVTVLKQPESDDYPYDMPAVMQFFLIFLKYSSPWKDYKAKVDSSLYVHGGHLHLRTSLETATKADKLDEHTHHDHRLQISVELAKASPQLHAYYQADPS